MVQPQRTDCAVVQNRKLVAWADLFSSFVIGNRKGDIEIPLSANCQRDSLLVSLPRGARQSGVQTAWLTTLAEDAEVSAASIFYSDSAHSWYIPMSLDLTLINSVVAISRKGDVDKPVYTSTSLPFWFLTKGCSVHRYYPAITDELPSTALGVMIFPARRTKFHSAGLKKKSRKLRYGASEDQCAGQCGAATAYGRAPAQCAHRCGYVPVRWGYFSLIRVHSKASLLGSRSASDIVGLNLLLRFAAIPTLLLLAQLVTLYAPVSDSRKLNYSARLIFVGVTCLVILIEDYDAITLKSAFPAAIALGASIAISDKSVSELELISCSMHLVFGALSYGSSELWQSVGFRLVSNGCLFMGVFASPASQFHAFYWSSCYTVSTTTLPRAATLVFGPTSRFFDFTSVYYLLAYFSGWEADTGHSQPLMLFLVYVCELMLRWLMAVAVASTSMTASTKGRASPDAEFQGYYFGLFLLL